MHPMPLTVRRVSRRNFLLGVRGGISGALALVACASPAPTAGPTSRPAAAPTSAPAAAAATSAPAAAGKPTTAAAVPTTAPAPAAPTSAAAAAATTAPAAVKKGGTLNWAEIADPISFDPHTRSNASASVPGRLIYE